jgi:hypothetical protein
MDPRKVLTPFYEIPLALLSFVFYKIVRLSLRFLVRLAASARKSGFSAWRVLDGPGLEKPLALPVTMTTGPRWNPHAFIASAGPFSVRETLAFELAPIQTSAKMWGVNIYRLSDHKTIHRIGSLDGPFSEPCFSFLLEPDTYVLGLRYYDWTSNVSLPAVFADGQQVVPEQTLPSPPNTFYESLEKRATLFYLFLHYYVDVMLRYRRKLPESFVASEFLPVGNPETKFYFGPLSAGEQVKLSLEEPVLSTYAVYLTTYNRRSFPEFWYEINKTEDTSPVTRKAGYYLIRLHRKRKVDISAEISVTVIGDTK